MALDPLAREVVRDGEHERVVVDGDRGDLAEPVAEGRLVEGAAQPADTSSQRLSAVGSIGCSTGLARPSLAVAERPRIAASPRPRQERFPARTSGKNCPICRENSLLHTALHRCGKPVSRPSPPRAFPRLFALPRGCGQLLAGEVRLYSRPAGRNCRPLRSFQRHETDLSAKRAPAEAQARLPRADVDACRPRDPQAPPRQGAQAPVGLAGAARAAQEPPLPLPRLRRRLPARPLGLDPVPDAVLVRARRESLETRASASPCRRRPATPSSATGSSASCARSGARSSTPRSVPVTNDYVLVVRAGPARGGRGARARAGSSSASTRCSRRSPRERCRAARSAGRRLLAVECRPCSARARLRLPLDARPVRPGGHLQVPPELLAVRDRRAAQARARQGLGSRRAGGSSAATRGRTAESTTRDPRDAPLRDQQCPPAARGRRPLAARALPLQRRAAVGVGDRRDDDRRADPARAADRPADPLDAVAPAARAGDEGDPAEVQGRPARS